MKPPHVDIIIIGAGISGICAGHYVRTQLPHKSFVILEGRAALGGTWDLFRYPGIRSDSDMHTLGFSFRPWPNPQALADGPSILQYLNDTVRACGLDAKIRYNRRVDTVSWSSKDARWTVTSRHPQTGEASVRTCNFVWFCTGYYRYEQGYMPDYKGVDRFGGRLIHPQHWPEDIDFDHKRVVVIGSGATAVTLLPAIAKRAAHITMLQRSPTYVMSLPSRDVFAKWSARLLGDTLGAGLTRWKNILRMMLFYELARALPKSARRLIIAPVRKALGEVLDVDTHFNPSYPPWDQRICFVPDADLFDALRRGDASVVTDHIEHFSPDGIVLRSGEQLDADIVISATGLNVQLAGGTRMMIDGQVIDLSAHTIYKGTMLNGVPNAVFSLGYTNASWTLKCELTSQWACRLIEHMDRHQYRVCTPRLPAHEDTSYPLIGLNSGYIRRAKDKLPSQGKRLPWRLYQNYLLDSVILRLARVNDEALWFE